MKLIPAPMRQFKTASMILVVIVGVLNLGVVLLAALAGLEVITIKGLAVGNAVLMFVIGSVRLVHQQVAMTTDQKVDMLDDVSAQPVHAGQADVAAVLVPLPPAQIQALPVLVDVDVSGR